MSLIEIVGSPEIMSGESEGNVDHATTVTLKEYSPKADQYSLFCEQFLERPVVSEDSVKASYGNITYYGGVRDDD